MSNLSVIQDDSIKPTCCCLCFPKKTNYSAIMQYFLRERKKTLLFRNLLSHNNKISSPPPSHNFIYCIGVTWSYMVIYAHEGEAIQKTTLFCFQ